MHWLQGPDGAAAVERAGRLQAEGVDLLPGLGRLRTEFGAQHAGSAWELARLRARARPVFGADADVLYLTADTLEQAGRPQLAARRPGGCSGRPPPSCPCPQPPGSGRAGRSWPPAGPAGCWPAEPIRQPTWAVRRAPTPSLWPGPGPACSRSTAIRSPAS